MGRSLRRDECPPPCGRRSPARSVEAQYGIGIGGLNAASAVLVLPVILFWRRLVRAR